MIVKRIVKIVFLYISQMSLLDKNINAQFFDIYKVTKKNDSLQLIIVSVNIYSYVR